MPSNRDASEIARSASEARKTVLRNVNLERYQAPPADTCYPLEYAFHLLGNVHGKLVLDLGCGSGEETIPLRQRGARVIGIDLSPDLLEVAHRRLQKYGLDADLRVRSAYDTQLPDGSVDVIFCIALLHHLEISRVKREMLRILKPDGFLIVQEPIRLSWSMKQLRRFFPKGEDVSDGEYPLNVQQLQEIVEGLELVASRNFRTPFVPLLLKAFHAPSAQRKIWSRDAWILRHFPALQHFSTVRVMALRPQQHLCRTASVA
jgi:2-polyprenyl-3-methyl-5-hydroxy-6-metoxy-1,4-benzoquinol methylase